MKEIVWLYFQARMSLFWDYLMIVDLPVFFPMRSHRHHCHDTHQAVSRLPDRIQAFATSANLRCFLLLRCITDEKTNQLPLSRCQTLKTRQIRENPQKTICEANCDVAVEYGLSVAQSVSITSEEFSRTPGLPWMRRSEGHLHQLCRSDEPLFMFLPLEAVRPFFHQMKEFQRGR